MGKVHFARADWRRHEGHGQELARFESIGQKF